MQDSFRPVMMRDFWEPDHRSGSVTVVIYVSPEDFYGKHRTYNLIP